MEKEDYVFEICQGQLRLFRIGMTKKALTMLQESINKTLERKMDKGMVGIVALQLDPLRTPGTPTDSKLVPNAPKTAYDLVKENKAKPEGG